MRLRWGRILGALWGTMAAVHLAPLVPLWLTMPAEPEVERAFAPPASLACATGEVLGAAALVHRGHEGESGGAAAEDVAALTALLQAARCERLTAAKLSDNLMLWSHGLDVLDPVARPDAAAEAALASWELAADQRRTGAYDEVGAWSTLEMFAASVVDEALLTGLDDAHLAEVQARLTRIATSELDWAAVAAREERMTWGRVPYAFDLPEPLLLPWRLVLNARRGDGASAIEARERVDEVRTRAAVLAGAAEMALHRRRVGACAAEESAVLVAIRGMELDVDRLADRCAVIGAFEGGAVVALAR